MLEDTGTALVITGATEVLMSTILVVDDDADTCFNLPILRGITVH